MCPCQMREGICTRNQNSLIPCHCHQGAFSICTESVTVICPGQDLLQDTISLTLAEVWTQYISFAAHSEMPQLPSCHLTQAVLSVGDATLSGAVIPNATLPRIAAEAAALSTQNPIPGQSRCLLMSNFFLPALSFSHPHIHRVDDCHVTLHSNRYQRILKIRIKQEQFILMSSLISGFSFLGFPLCILTPPRVY